MEFDRNENRAAGCWFFGAGLFAICMALFVYNLDLYITNSDSEKIRGQEMREVRIAQASFVGSPQDPRIKASNP